MADCTKLDAAMKGINANSQAADFGPVMDLLKDYSKSHILGSDMLKNAEATAQQMAAKGVFTKDLDAGIPGAKAYLQQNHGKPQFIDLTEGNRNEGLRLDPDTSKPLLDMMTITCSAQPGQAPRYYQVNSFVENGKQVAPSFTLPNRTEIRTDIDGKPTKIYRY